MKKRYLFAALASLPFLTIASKAEASSNRNSATWKVPPGIKKIRVRSWNTDGSKNLDRTLSVEPGQIFRIDAIED